VGAGFLSVNARLPALSSQTPPLAPAASKHGQTHVTRDFIS